MRMAMFRFLILLCFTLPVVFVQAQTPQVSMDKNKIRIGEQIKMNIRIDFSDPNTNIIWPVFGDTLTTAKIELVSQSDVIRRNDSGMYESREMIITSFDSGYHAIPPIPLVVNGDTLHSDALLLQVEGVAVDTTQQFRDIKGIADEAYTWADFFRDLWYWIMEHIYLVIGLFVLLTGLIYFFIKSRKKELQPAPLPSIPAHIEAFGKLRLLENKLLWQNGQSKEYFTELSEIIRHYIERRFEVPALEQTTDEVLHFLRVMEMDEEARRHLVYVLKLSDLVKFAKENPAPFENESAMKRSFSFVELTLIETVEKKETEV